MLAVRSTFAVGVKMIYFPHPRKSWLFEGAFGDAHGWGLCCHIMIRVDHGKRPCVIEAGALTFTSPGEGYWYFTGALLNIPWKI